MSDHQIQSEKCINPLCEKTQLSRGLCATCCGILRKLIKGGAFTMEEAEVAGKIFPLDSDLEYSTDRQTWKKCEVEA